MAKARWTQSVIVTLALVSGCDKGESEGPKSSGEASGGEGEKADGGDKAEDWTQKERVEKNEDGTCTRYVSVRCPEGVMCNPPPPEDVPCPPELAGPDPKAATGATGTTAAAGPVFEITEGKRTTRVLEDGTCEASFSMDCPPGANCNPPRPQLVDCPPALAAGAAVNKAEAAAKAKPEPRTKPEADK